jgi:hypothetical protein
MTRLIALSISLLAMVVVTAGPASAAPSADGQAVADAYGDMLVFVLNVAAGNDGQPQKPDGEQTFKAALAEQFAGQYATLSAADQQSLAVLPEVAAQLHQAWPLISEEQRNATRDQWAASVQPMAVQMPCELFDALARAQLLPSYGEYTQTNINHLRQCWHDHPELTQDPEERSSGANYGSSNAGGPSMGSHSTYMAMFNANLYRYTASMNIASMGTATYSVKSYP